MTVYRAPKHAAIASAALITFAEGVEPLPAKGGSFIGSASPGKKRPATAAQGKPAGLSLKPKGTSAATPETSQLDGDLSEDPIAQSLACRISLGGLGSNATEADAKKNKYPVFNAAKHTILKGAALLDIGVSAKASDDSSGSFISPKKMGRPGSTSSGFKGLKPPTKATSSTKQLSSTKKKGDDVVDLGPAISKDEDPIAASL